MNLENLQDLIDYIAVWYEIKYPERELDYIEGRENILFDYNKKLEKEMDINQLLLRLPHSSLSLMKSPYIGNGGGLKRVLDDNFDLIGYKPVIYVNIKRKNIKNEFYLVVADSITGEIEKNHSLEDYIKEKDINLERLLYLLKEKNNIFDYKELEITINDHNNDMELRKKVLELVSIKLLYSRNTIPEYGYIRSIKFIEEFNKELDINLNRELIDNIYNKDYSKGRRLIKK